MQTEALNSIGLAVLGLLGTGGIAAIISIIRTQIKAASAASVDVANDSAEKGQLARLEAEINRLESLVIRMQKRIDALESRLHKTNLLFVDVQQALIEVERSMLGCDCQEALEPRVRLQEAQDILRRAILENTNTVVEAEAV